jgi:hypothetical protein
MLHFRLIRLKNTLLKCHIVDCEKKFGVIHYVMAYTPKEYLFSINHGFQYTCQSCKRKKKKLTAEYMWIIKKPTFPVNHEQRQEEQEAFSNLS